MKTKVALFVLILMSFILSACGGGSSQEEPSVVKIGWTGGPDSLNPGAAWLAKAYTIFELVYDSMYEVNLDGTYADGLVESVERSDDGLIYTFKIKDGVKWHDGKPLTAKDVAFTYNLVMAHEDFPTLNSYTTSFESVEATDDTTVVLTLNEPVPSIESKLVFLYILPEHIWKDHAEGNAAAEFANEEMIGSGPFKIKEYKANEYIQLEKNEDYHGNIPKVDEVIFQSFQTPDVLIQAMKSGQVDMITEMPSTGVEALKDVENVSVEIGSPLAPDLTDIILNQTAPENCPTEDGGLCTGHPALRDRNVRLAMAHATDKEKIIEIVMLGLASKGIALIPDGMGAWFNSKIKDYAYDPALANQILDDAGYLDVNSDGVREMPDGTTPLTFRLNWPSDSVVAPRMAELLQEMWNEIGITTQPQAVDPDALTAQCCPALDYDVMLWGWVADPDPQTLLIIPTTDQIPTGYNETGYSNPRYDELFAQQSVELNPEKRKELVWEMQKITHDNVTYIIPFYAKQTQAYRTDRFKGWLTGQPKLALEDVSSLTVIEPVK
ncbi:MAG: ABC transporter substrate-binding protein [Anaerolineaceae bacterium]|nr:ABC transporter substrate-binding protein [Anaerolineaceae bacterium]